MFPGASHHARWMSKIIYCYKNCLLQDELDLPNEIISGVKELCIFFALFFAKAWLVAPIPSEAAVNDLHLLCQLEE
jgi:hypothetical protein